MNRRRVAIALTGIVALAGAAAFIEIRARRIPSAVFSDVRSVTARLTKTTSYLQQPNLTFADAFEKLEREITEIDSIIVRVEALKTSKNSANLKVVEDYLQASFETLRAILGMFRNGLAVEPAIAAYFQADRAFQDARFYDREDEQSRREDAKQEADAAVREFSAAEKAVRQELAELATARTAAARALPEDILVDTRVFKEIEQILDASHTGFGEMLKRLSEAN